MIFGAPYVHHIIAVNESRLCMSDFMNVKSAASAFHIKSARHPPLVNAGMMVTSSRTDTGSA
jgi:hypothetical protein